MAECRPMDQDIAEVLLDAETIRARIAELGAQLAADYRGKEVVNRYTYRGAVVFYAGSGAGDGPAAEDGLHGHLQLWRRAEDLRHRGASPRMWTRASPASM